MKACRFFLLLAIALVLSLAALAQPAPTDSWLTVTVVNADGTPYIYMPKVQLTTDVPGVRITSRPVADNNKAILFAGLKPGDYQISITLTATGITLPRRAIKMVTGANNFEWKLTDPITVTGQFTLDGKEAVAVKQVQAFLVTSTTRAAKGGVAPRIYYTYSPLTNLTLTDDGKYTFVAQSSGEHIISFFTEQGYCDTAKIDIPEDTKKTFTAPLVTLQPGAKVKFTVTDAATGEVTPNATVRMTYFNATTAITNPALKLPVNVILTPKITMMLSTDDKGILTTMALPEGKWQYQVYVLPLKATKPKVARKISQAVTIEVKAGETTELAVKL
ncbi:MAG: hypothetical protein WCJ56_03100 [bacterium]